MKRHLLYLLIEEEYRQMGRLSRFLVDWGAPIALLTPLVVAVLVKLL